jgi:hypothetical protein
MSTSVSLKRVRTLKRKSGKSKNSKKNPKKSKREKTAMSVRRRGK